MSIDFLVEYEDGSTSESTETGIWGVSGDIYFTVIRGITYDGEIIAPPPEDASMYHTYRVLKLTKNSFEYQTIVTGNVFRSKKVPDTFVIPGAQTSK